MKDCKENYSLKKSGGSPVLTVKKTIKLSNRGQTAFYVKGFHIENNECEGYGFRVLNCEGFSLLPKEDKEIDIAFTPDFTLALSSRTLSILSTLTGSQSVLNFTLQASIPY